MKHTSKIAFSGIFAALGLAILFFSGVIPIATVALPALAGCVLIPITAELGEKWGFGVYAVTAVLGFFLTADKQAFLLYLLFFGYYPVLYATLSKIPHAVLRYGAKLLLFNVAAVVDYFLLTQLFGIPFASIALFGAYTPLLVLGLANLVFVVFDFSLKGLIQSYFSRLHTMARRFLAK